MYCEKCGKKNDANAKFCGSCGAKIEVKKEPKKVPTKTPDEKQCSFKEKLKQIPKKVQIGAISCFVLVIGLIIVLSVLLNNPVKKIENYMTSYYDKYTDNYESKELVEIGNILKKYKNNDKTLESIQKQTNTTIYNWVKNFNKSYPSQEKLEETYQKLTGVLNDIYDYYNGLSYMLDRQTYSNYMDELYDLYYSKIAYLTAMSYDEDNYQRYYYSQKVIDTDNYYASAQETISKFISSELEDLKNRVLEKVKVTDTSTDEEKYINYLEIIEYLNDNKYNNNLDLSTSEEYKNILKEYVEKFVSSIQAFTNKLVDDGSVKDAIKVIEDALKALNRDLDVYKELEDLKANLTELLPVSITKMYEVGSVTSTIHTSSYQTEIEGNSYEGMIRYRFNGKNGEITYRTNKEYSRFRSKIVIGANWDKDFDISIVITGDDKELYRLEHITKETQISEDINIDISGIDDIKIEFITSSGEKNTGGYRFIYLVEPYLYK